MKNSKEMLLQAVIAKPMSVDIVGEENKMDFFSQSIKE